MSDINLDTTKQGTYWCHTCKSLWWDGPGESAEENKHAETCIAGAVYVMTKEIRSLFTETVSLQSQMLNAIKDLQRMIQK